MIKKLHSYIQSGGIIEVISYALTLIKKIFYYKSETIFLYLTPENAKHIKKDVEFSFKKINNTADLEKIGFPRIKTLPYNKWFDKGSIAIIGFYDNKPVSFTWSHFKHHTIHGIGTIDLSKNMCWIGPTFVHKTMRRKGMNKAQIIHQIKISSKETSYFITSANSKNIASIKSFAKLGFQRGLIHSKYFGVLSSNKIQMTFLNNGKNIIYIK